MAHRDKSETAGILFPPPLMFFAMLGAGIALHKTAPVDLHLSTVLRVALGILFALPSGYLALGSYFVMHRDGTPFDPGRPTTAVCCQGVFRMTRNPMYLSLVLLLLSIGLALSCLWLTLLGPVLLVLFDRLAVCKEEAYLTERFGERYLEYKRTVRRWL